MKRKFNFIAGGLLALIFFPVNALAYSDWGLEVKISSLFDVFFDILGFFVVLVALGMGIEMLRKFSGKLRSTWIYCMMAVLIFLILQIMTLLSAFYSIDFSGIFPILKFLMGLFFLASVFTVRSMVNQIIRNKALRKRNDITDTQ